MSVTGSVPYPSRSFRPQPWFQALTLVTVLSAFALVVLGGVVRVTGSGLGCPDWPLCYGGILPPPEFEAIVEFSHRLVASALLGPLIGATCVAAWIFYRRQPWVVVPATLAVVLVLCQAVLGGASVLTHLSGMLVASHLALAEVLLACLTVLLVVAYRGPLSAQRLSPFPSFSRKRETRPPSRHSRAGGNPAGGRRGQAPKTTEGAGTDDNFPWLVLASALGVYVLIMSGSYVTVSGATAACSDWPLCQGRFLPGNELAWVHMAHRAVSVVVGAGLGYTLFAGLRTPSRLPQVRLLCSSAAALFLLQVAVGAATILLKFPPEWRALHLSLATMLWGVMVALAALNLTVPARNSGEVPHA